MQQLLSALYDYQPQKEILTQDDVSTIFNVSGKTISRWRKQGLKSELFLMNSRHRVGFRREWISEYIMNHAQRIKRGATFSQMSDSQREEIILRARRMAAVGNTPSLVIKRLANNTGRSPEAIRYTLKNYDLAHPENPVFVPKLPKMDEKDRDLLYNRYCSGVSVDVLCAEQGCTKTSMYRCFAEVRARKIFQLPLEHICSDEFQNADPETVIRILAEMPPYEGRIRKTRLPAGLPSYLASLYAVPLLSFAQEQHLFRKMNFLKWRAALLRVQLDPAHPRSTIMEQIERDYAESVKAKNIIISANLRLVVSIAKKHICPADGLFDLISDGNMSLIRAAEKFDYTRGNRFSTYASWAIMKNYSRAISDQLRYKNRFQTLDSDSFGETEEDHPDYAEVEMAYDRKEKKVAQILSLLSPREQQIIIRRYGLNRDREPLTLKQVGLEMGVTKERIRQIEILALEKLRKAAREEILVPARVG